MTERIDPASDRAVYRQIADHLRQGILSGEYEPGQQLPSESQLMTRYDVSRVTARRALSVLVTDGLVLAEHGRGWFVRRTPPVRRLGSDRFARRREGKAAFTVDMEANERDFKVDVLYVGPGNPPREVAERLGSKETDRVVIRRRLYIVDSQPIEYATSYIPTDVAEDTSIAEVNPGPGGIYARMEDKGYVFERYDEDVTARTPTEEESRLLQLPVGLPVLHLVRTAVASGRAVEVCDTIMNSAAFVLHYELPASLPQ